MQSSSPIRSLARTASVRRGGMRRFADLLKVLSCVITLPLFAAQQHPAVVQRPAAPSARSVPKQQGTPGPRNQEHLSEWMSRHRDLSLPQQQHALESEPGFREYPAQTQQRLRDRLTELNNMKPAQRQRLLERNEAMEHLAVPQRQQVRSAMLQLGSLPEDRRKAVSRAFRDMRSMPEADRQQYINSPAFRSQYNEQEVTTLNSLMAVEPYLPGKRVGEAAPPQP